MDQVRIRCKSKNTLQVLYGRFLEKGLKPRFDGVEDMSFVLHGMADPAQEAKHWQTWADGFEQGQAAAYEFMRSLLLTATK